MVGVEGAVKVEVEVEAKLRLDEVEVGGILGQRAPHHTAASPP